MKFTKQGQQVIEYLLVFGAVVATALTVSPYVGRRVDQTMRDSLNELQSEIHSYSWAKGACGACMKAGVPAACGGGQQSCTTVCMRSDGLEVEDSFCEGTPPTFTQDCNAQPCPIDCVWGSWENGECLPVCGTSRSHTDTREIVVEAQFGGVVCDPADGVRTITGAPDCPDSPCPGDCGNDYCEPGEQTTCPEDCGCQFQLLDRDQCNGCGGAYCEDLDVSWHASSTCEDVLYPDADLKCVCGSGYKPVGSLTLIGSPLDTDENCETEAWGGKTYWAAAGYTCKEVKEVSSPIPPCCGDGVRNGSEECEEEDFGLDTDGKPIIDCSGLPEYSYPANLDCYVADPANVDPLECTYDKSDCIFVCATKSDLATWCDDAHHDDGLISDLGPVTYYTGGSCPAVADTCQAQCLTNLEATAAGDGCECPTATDVYCSSAVNPSWDDNCHECCVNADCPPSQVCDDYVCYDRTQPCSWCWDQALACDYCGGTYCCPREIDGLPYVDVCEQYHGSDPLAHLGGCNCPPGEVPLTIAGPFTDPYAIIMGGGPVQKFGVDCRDAAAGYTCVPYVFQYATFGTPDAASCCGDYEYTAGEGCACPDGEISVDAVLGECIVPECLPNDSDTSTWCPDYDEGLTQDDQPVKYYDPGDCPASAPCGAECKTGLVATAAADGCECSTAGEVYCSSADGFDDQCHECCVDADCGGGGKVCDDYKCYDRSQPCSYCVNQQDACDFCGGSYCCPRTPTGGTYLPYCEQVYTGPLSHYSACNCPTGEIPNPSLFINNYDPQDGDAITKYGVDCQDVNAGYTCVPAVSLYGPYPSGTNLTKTDECCGDYEYTAGSGCACPVGKVDILPIDGTCVAANCATNMTNSTWCPDYDVGVTDEDQEVIYVDDWTNDCPIAPSATACYAACDNEQVATLDKKGCQCPTSTDKYCSDGKCDECCSNSDCTAPETCEMVAGERICVSPCTWTIEQFDGCMACGGSECETKTAGVPPFASCGSVTNNTCSLCTGGQVPTTSDSVVTTPGNCDTGTSWKEVHTASGAYTCAAYVPKTYNPVACCGDGIVSSPEQCDDGNVVNTDACTNSCKFPVCGDLIVSFPEQCDDGNVVNTDACTNSCKFPVCGDLIVSPPEQCDDGNVVNTDACTNSCKFPVCGDFIVSPPEICDTGAVDTAACDNNCTSVVCPDGHRNAPAGEACDDGNMVNTDACTNTCKLPVCGDFIVSPPETCDAGAVDTAVCDNNCTSVVCPDGHRNAPAGEACDDGNMVNTDACTNSCKLPVCGDLIVSPPEQCDDGNGNNLDGCSNSCKLPVCGDALCQSTETADTCPVDCKITCNGTINSTAAPGCFVTTSVGYDGWFSTSCQGPNCAGTMEVHCLSGGVLDGVNDNCVNSCGDGTCQSNETPASCSDDCVCAAKSGVATTPVECGPVTLPATDHGSTSAPVACMNGCTGTVTADCMNDDFSPINDSCAVPSLTWTATGSSCWTCCGSPACTQRCEAIAGFSPGASCSTAGQTCGDYPLTMCFGCKQNPVYQCSN